MRSLEEANPEGPSTQYIRTLVPKVWLLGPESLYIGYLDPLWVRVQGTFLAVGFRVPTQGKLVQLGKGLIVGL